MHVIVLASLLAASSPDSDQPAVERIFVLDLAPSGVDANLSRNLSEVLVVTIRKALPDATVQGQDDVNSMLAVEKQRDLLGCQDDVSCLAELGGALGANYFATGTIGRVGAVYLLTLKLIDTGHAKTVQHISERIAGGEELLIEATRQWGLHLVRPSEPAGYGYLDIGGKGNVSIDGEPVGSAPLRHHVATKGPHVVAWPGLGPDKEVSIDVQPYVTVSVAPPSPSVASRKEGPAVETSLGPSDGSGFYGHFLGGATTTVVRPSGMSDEGMGAVLGVRVGYRFPSGVVALASGRWQMYKLRVPDGTSSRWMEAEFRSGGIGAGYRSGGRFRWQGALVAEYFSDDVCCSFDDNYETKVRLWRDTVGDAIAILHPSVGGSFLVSRWFAVGLRLELPITLYTKASLMGLHAGLTLGVPSPIDNLDD